MQWLLEKEKESDCIKNEYISKEYSFWEASTEQSMLEGFVVFVA